MMKRFSLFFLFLISSIVVILPIVSAAIEEYDPPQYTQQVEELEIGFENQEIVYVGRYVGVKSYSLNKIILEVDGRFKEFFLNKEEEFDGLNITYLYFKEGNKYRNWSIGLNISTLYSCGNNVCEDDEKGFCCSDCGCPSIKMCVDNRCVDPADNKCINNSQCDDGDPCTKDSCKNAPRKCFNEQITSCYAGDQCCPKRCDLSSDLDCSDLKLCESDTDCDDDMLETVDICSSITNRCYYINESSQDGFVVEPNCLNSDDCDDGNDCTDDRCSGITDVCYHINNTNCIPIIENSSMGVNRLEEESAGNVWFGLLALVVLVLLIKRINRP